MSLYSCCEQSNQFSARYLHSLTGRSCASASDLCAKSQAKYTCHEGRQAAGKCSKQHMEQGSASQRSLQAVVNLSGPSTAGSRAMLTSAADLN